MALGHRHPGPCPFLSTSHGTHNAQITETWPTEKLDWDGNHGFGFIAIVGQGGSLPHAAILNSRRIDEKVL